MTEPVVAANGRLATYPLVTRSKDEGRGVRQAKRVATGRARRRTAWDVREGRLSFRRGAAASLETLSEHRERPAYDLPLDRFSLT